MERLRSALSAVRSKLERARVFRDACARAAAESKEVAGRLETARRALVTACADAAAGVTVAPVRLDALRADLAAAERDNGIRAEVRNELASRLEGFATTLEDAQSDLVRAVDETAEAASSDLLSEARRLLAPRFRLVAELANAGASANAAVVSAFHLASTLGVAVEPDPTSAEGKLADELRAAASDVSNALEEIREAARQRRNAEQLAARGPRLYGAA